MDRNLFDIPHHANLFALIYKAAVDFYGEKGALAADEGTKLYGQQRGRRMAQRALKDGAPLTMESYLLYGEWIDKNAHSKSYIASKSPVYCTNSTVCGWCEAWKSAGLIEYGKNYCRFVDHNLVKGFNPQLKLDITSVLSMGGEVCGFRWNGFSLEDEVAEKAYSRKKAALGSKPVMDFLYHTGHLLSAMKQAIGAELGTDAANKISDAAMTAYREMYGSGMADAVLQEAEKDFSVVNY